MVSKKIYQFHMWVVEGGDILQAKFLILQDHQIIFTWQFNLLSGRLYI